MGQLHSIDCEQVRGHISAGLDGELSEVEQARVAAHVGSCAGCSAFAGGVRDTAGGEVATKQGVDYRPFPLSRAPRNDPAIFKRGQSSGCLLRFEVRIELGPRRDANGHALRVAPERPDELELLIVA